MPPCECASCRLGLLERLDDVIERLDDWGPEYERIEVDVGLLSALLDLAKRALDDAPARRARGELPS